MPHTASRYMADLGFTDGRIFLGPGDIVWDVAAQASVTRIAAGQWGVLHTTGANTTNFAGNLTQALLRKTGFFEDLQEQFGGTGIAGRASIPGRPDTFGAMNTGQQLQPRTAFIPKGFILLSYDVIYSIATLAITTHTTRADQTQYTNNVAAATTVVLASGANGLQTATQANPYVTNVPIPPAQQIYRTLADMALWVEVQVVAAATSVYTLIGIDCLVTYNYA